MSVTPLITWVCLLCVSPECWLYQSPQPTDTENLWWNFSASGWHLPRNLDQLILSSLMLLCATTTAAPQTEQLDSLCTASDMEGITPIQSYTKYYLHSIRHNNSSRTFPWWLLFLHRTCVGHSLVVIPISFPFTYSNFHQLPLCL